MAELCDLHIHSNFSDSDMPIEEIFQIAARKKIACIAITDHDTLAGVPLAEKYSEQYGVELVRGLEISARHSDSEVHILGLLVDPGNAELKVMLTDMRKLRIERIMEMADKLNGMGVKFCKDEFSAFIKGVIPTRLHLALYLKKTGHINDLKTAFTRYIGVNKPAYCAGFKYSVKEVIAAIHSAGGLAFIAHPHILVDQRWVPEFINDGVDGIEVIYKNMPPRLYDVYERYINEKNLLRCGGSDAHGSYKKHVQIGDITVPYEWVLRMKERVNKDG